MATQKDLVYKDRQEIIRRFVEGEEVGKIADNFSTTKRVINKILEEDKETRTELEAIYSNLSVARQNRSIEELKTETLDYVRKTIKDAEELPQKERVQYLDKLGTILAVYDRIHRLNRGEATDRGENINKSVKYDVAQIMKQFKTEDEKKAFLMDKIN